MFSENISNQRGVSLLEIVIVIGLTVLIVGVTGRYFRDQTKDHEAHVLTTEMRQDVRAAMDMMVREIRMAGYDPTDAGFVGIPYDTAQVTIKADIDGNGTVSGENEIITYSYDETNQQILRTTGGASETLMENVLSFSFDCRDAGGASITSAADEGNIRQVDIAINARTRMPDSRVKTDNGYRTYCLQSLVVPRNLAL